MKRGRSSLHFRLFYFACLLSALALWLTTLATTTISFSTPDLLHYVRSLPLSYWASISLLSFVIVVRFSFPERIPNLSVMDILVLFTSVIILFGTPSFVEEMPRSLDAYAHVGGSVFVASSGRAGAVLGELQIPGTFYASNFPGYFILMANLLLVTDLPAISLIKFYPIFLMATISLIIYSISRRVSGNLSIGAPLLFLSMSWFQEFHSSPQSLGLLLYLVLWLCLTKVIFSKEIKPQKSLLFLVLVTIAGIVISHQGTPVFILLNLASIAISIWLFKRIKSYEPRNYFIITIFFAGVLFFSWSLYSASSAFISSILEGRQAITNLIYGASSLSKPSGYWTATYVTVNNLRITEHMILNILVVISTLLFLKNEKSKKVGIVLGSWWFSCWVFIIFSILNSGLYSERAALFGLFPATILVSFAMQHLNQSSLRKSLRISCLILILWGTASLPLLRNANDCFETPNKSSFAGIDFAVVHSTKEIVFPSQIRSLFVFYGQPQSILNRTYAIFVSGRTPDSERIIKSSLLIFDKTAFFFAVNQGGETAYVQLSGFAEDSFPRIYDNRGTEIYYVTLQLDNLSFLIG